MLLRYQRISTLNAQLIGISFHHSDFILVLACLADKDEYKRQHEVAFQVKLMSVSVIVFRFQRGLLIM